MNFLKRHGHLIAFWALTLAFLKLQFINGQFGWPIGTSRFTNLGFLAFVIMSNFIYAIFIFGIAMIPFGYGQRPSFSLSSLIVLVVAGSVGIRLLTINNYIQSLGLVDQILMVFLTTMSCFGIAMPIWNWLQGHGNLGTKLH